ncbi:MAG: hypothetical protein PHC84_04540 [Clostridia bacterium]|nr:hypothetical protein [Clostridia bacterium]
MKKLLLLLIDCTWAGLQNLLGIINFHKYRNCPGENFFGANIAYHSEEWGGISLGRFIVINGTRGDEWIAPTKVHEYGHYVQSLILGPFYLLIIGIPSMIWCNAKRFKNLRDKKGVSYYAFYPEKWANLLGEKFTGLSATRREHVSSGELGK